MLESDSRCPETPAFEIECADCPTYFELCVAHRMDLEGDYGISCPGCESTRFYLRMMS